MRVFTAVDIDKPMMKAMSELQDSLCRRLDVKKSDIKWVRPDQMHLTLNFLGEISDQQAADVCRLVENAAGGFDHFELEIGSAGFFGGGSARVLWVGVGQGGEKLCLLQKQLAQQLESQGLAGEKRQFAGHLTMCRIRNPRAGAKAAETIKEYSSLMLGIVPVEAVLVYQSQLTDAGPVYTPLGSYRLK